jgi:glycosyltransferase involved in cell wall biosynthesis
MKILYITYSCFPSHAANSIAVMRMCQALSPIAKVSLIAIKGNRHLLAPEYTAYAKTSAYKSYLLPRCFLFLREKPLAFSSALIATFMQADLCYSRDIFVANFLSRIGHRVFYEIHQLEQDNAVFNRIFRSQLLLMLRHNRYERLICISEALKSECVKFGFPREKLITLHSGVTISNEKLEERMLVRTKMGISALGPLIMYSGSLHPGKGINTIIELSKLRPKYLFVILGGSEIEFRQFCSAPTSNLFHFPQVPHESVFSYLAAADIFILPFSTSTTLKFHSPLKLFEYLSVGRPIIASNTWGIREIISHMENGILVNPDNVQEFATFADIIISDPALSARLSNNGLKTAQMYTWETRARKIVDLAFARQT